MVITPTPQPAGGTSPTRNPFHTRVVKRFLRAVKPEQLPEALPRVPEVAIAGRSNVGKSTLLNSLLGIKNRDSAAPVGDRPGVTQSLDFYRLGPKSRWVLTDGVVVGH